MSVHRIWRGARRSLALLLLATCHPAFGADRVVDPAAEAGDSAAAAASDHQPEASPFVGMEGVLRNVLLPGPELAVSPESANTAPVVLRITARYPHGTIGHRYDFAFVGHEPGTFDLAELLVVEESGERLPGLPPIPVAIEAILPPGPPGLLNELEAPAIPRLGGYRIALAAVGVLWLAGLLTMLARRRMRAATSDSAAGEASEPTLVERLRSLSERAVAGELDSSGKAELERLVLGFWRDRLALDGLEMREALRRIHEDDEAGSLLRQVESWLHSPPHARQPFDPASSLRPYVTPDRPAGSDAVGSHS